MASQSTERLQDDPAGLDRAAALLREGRLVAFGTETVYGLGADATSNAAVAAVFDAKGRPHFNPLICHYPDADAAFAHVQAPEAAQRLAALFWPGPLTLVLPRRVTCPVALLAGAGLETLAIRVPAHPTALRLLRAAGRPIAAPSANRSGEVSPTTAAHVLAGLEGRIAAVLDSGPCRVGVESTVLDLSAGAPFLLRPGGVSVEAIGDAIGPVGRGITPLAAEAPRTLRSPGLLVSTTRRGCRCGSGRRAAGARTKGCWRSARRRPPRDARVPAQRRWATWRRPPPGCSPGLRWLDAEGCAAGACRGIAAMPVPAAGLGLAVNDRLQRAAAPRD